jgi:hypothetical protein
MMKARGGRISSKSIRITSKELQRAVAIEKDIILQNSINGRMKKRRTNTTRSAILDPSKPLKPR